MHGSRGAHRALCIFLLAHTATSYARTVPSPYPKPEHRLAIANAIVVGGCTPGAANLLATAQARAEAQGNGGKFRSVAQASAAAQCLPGFGAAGRRL